MNPAARRLDRPAAPGPDARGDYRNPPGGGYWWAGYPVRYFRPATIGIRHPEAGLIALEMFQLRLVDQPSLIMVIQVPAGKTSLARIRSLLAKTGQQ